MARRGYVKKHEVLDKLVIGRRGAVQVRTEAKINSPAYQSAGAVIEAIDQLAEQLTGDPTYFHLKAAAEKRF